jgi:hypothetical protein
MKTRLIEALVLGLAIALASAGAHAQPLPSVVTGASVFEQPGTTFNFTVQVTNTSSITSINDFTAFYMGYQMIAEPGAVGTLSIVAAIQPSSSPVLTAGTIATFFDNQAVLPTAINGTTAYTVASLGNDVEPEQGDTIAASQTSNLVTLQVQASANADGRWKLFAVNALDSGNPVSAWQQVGSGNDFAFGNLPTATTSLELAVISVPEPSALVLAGIAVLFGAGRLGYRRGRAE